MAKYDGLKDYKNTTPEQKLAILRSEMITPISTIQGYAEIVKRQIELGDIEALPKDFNIWINRIADAAGDLHEVLEILTGPQQET
jgi:hypothetical protein